MIVLNPPLDAHCRMAMPLLSSLTHLSLTGRGLDGIFLRQRPITKTKRPLLCEMQSNGRFVLFTFEDTGRSPITTPGTFTAW
jgi:hypothetical protein